MSQRSEGRLAFDDALAEVAKRLRQKDGTQAAEALRSLSVSAIALADELHGV